MKTVIAAAAAAILGVGIAPAQETVKTLYQGDVAMSTQPTLLSVCRKASTSSMAASISSNDAFTTA